MYKQYIIIIRKIQYYKKVTSFQINYSFSAIPMKITTLFCETWQDDSKMFTEMRYTWYGISAKMEKTGPQKS